MADMAAYNFRIIKFETNPTMINQTFINRNPFTNH